MSQSAAARTTGGWVHFAIAAGALLVGAIGWQALGVTLAKKAVPPPAGTELEDHRLLGFPQRLGTFVLAPERERSGTEKDPKDGVEVADEELLALLGTLKNRWNWYYMASYRDTEPGPTKRYVRLDLTYYTGLLEAAPHDPERCIAAQGGTILRQQREPIEVLLPGLAEPWAAEWSRIEVMRTPYLARGEGGERYRGVQYHVFSLNGRPTCRWETVRWNIGKPWVKYCYFAKIQLAPVGPERGDLPAGDALCRRFLRQAMPEILKYLRTAEDVRQLETGGDTKPPRS